MKQKRRVANLVTNSFQPQFTVRQACISLTLSFIKSPKFPYAGSPFIYSSFRERRKQEWDPPVSSGEVWKPIRPRAQRRTVSYMSSSKITTSHGDRWLSTYFTSGSMLDGFHTRITIIFLANVKTGVTILIWQIRKLKLREVKYSLPNLIQEVSALGFFFSFLRSKS